ncbi:hypothetical protein RSOLAG22IIIB_11714 [Rhizoctonia solani]|uniref:Uncharacterized protein n=1 Tax=Rhizoctonia solani TaxID=456999 RepID=A0A0K6G9U1_9AGAM|nr:hypothetical protein RSOLAG22IIIB_11714 [Rhizoctonia solani]
MQPNQRKRVSPSRALVARFLAKSAHASPATPNPPFFLPICESRVPTRLSHIESNKVDASKDLEEYVLGRSNDKEAGGFMSGGEDFIDDLYDL